jgi:acetylornithine deacetylase/succinyl-diaminopimelate desuccinylase-like protein
MQSVLRHLDDHRAEHEGWISTLCRIPSISTKTEHRSDMAKAAEWLRERFEQSGLVAEIHATPGHPIVYAEHCQAGDAPTVLFYGHYDVQPEGDLSLWDAGPFEPTRDGAWLVCRGAADDKGSLLSHVRAVTAWLATEQRLPVNVKFLIEGEEEISSPNLGAYLEQHRERLACDHIVISDTGLFADGWPAITLGVRGILFKEIRVSGPKHDLHSGSFGGTVANPANVLAAIVASLHDENHRVTIPGFYDDVADLDAALRTRIDALPHDDDEYAAQLGVPGLTGETGFSTNERRWLRPTLDVNGIYGGFMAEGANTIIPARAGAKISMRLVPRQRAAALSRAFDDAIRARCPDTVRLEILDHGHADAYVAPHQSPIVDIAQEALAAAFDREPALILEGGSLPILALFKQQLGADSLLMGLASPQCNAHGPNEKVNLDDLLSGARASARLLAGLAGEA